MTAVDDRNPFVDEGFPRPEPTLTPRTTAFWTAGGDGVLHLARCEDCGTWMHPPRPVCGHCRAMSMSSQPVSGVGIVHTFTINRYQWSPTLEPPYVIAEIELPEQAGLRLTTALVECEVDAVHIGMEVEVCFARSGDAWIPLFRPVSS